VVLDKVVDGEMLFIKTLNMLLERLILVSNTLVATLTTVPETSRLVQENTVTNLTPVEMLVRHTDTSLSKTTDGVHVITLMLLPEMSIRKEMILNVI
jgi:hypothetical protein